MPIKLNVNESGINHVVFIFENPSKLMPISSGKGDAMMKPPAKKVSHLKYLIWNKILIRLPTPLCLNNSNRCSENLSRTNRKIIRSPTTEPSAPKIAVTKTELTLAISPSVTIAGAAVKTDVKNIPAIKLPNHFTSFVATKILDNESVLTKTTAMAILSTINNPSFNKKFRFRMFELITKIISHNQPIPKIGSEPALNFLNQPSPILFIILVFLIKLLFRS